MKKEATLLLSIVLVATILISCNRNRRIGKRLDGTWNVTSVTVNNNSLTGNDKPEEIKFVNCRTGGLDLINFCSGTLYYSSDSESFSWYIYEKGRQLMLSFSTSFMLDGEYEIVEDDKDRFEIVSFNGDVEMVFTK